MKPQLTMMEVGGAHNRDLNKTSARILKGGSWKKQRIVVIIPAGEMIPAKAALSHWNLAFPPNNGLVRLLAQGMEVGDAYSSAIEQIVEHDELKHWEYILTVEHDNLPPHDGVVKLVEAMENHPEFACISGLYFTKGEGGCAQIWGDIKDPVINFRPQIPQGDGLMECYGTGMGFALWRIKMFRDKNLERPWFKTHNGLDGKGIGTQDLVFWHNARKHGYRCAVDCSVRVGHIDYTGAFSNGVKDMIW